MNTEAPKPITKEDDLKTLERSASTKRSDDPNHKPAKYVVLYNAKRRGEYGAQVYGFAETIQRARMLRKQAAEAHAKSDPNADPRIYTRNGRLDYIRVV